MKRTMIGLVLLNSIAILARKTHKKFILAIVCALSLGLTPALFGQAVGSFSGNVLDKSGSGIAGATITVRSQGTGLERDSKTDSAGHYLIPFCRRHI